MLVTFETYSPYQRLRRQLFGFTCLVATHPAPITCISYQRPQILTPNNVVRQRTLPFATDFQRRPRAQLHSPRRLPVYIVVMVIPCACIVAFPS